MASRENYFPIDYVDSSCVAEENPWQMSNHKLASFSMDSAYLKRN